MSTTDQLPARTPTPGPSTPSATTKGHGTLGPAVRWATIAACLALGSLITSLVWGWNIVGAVALGALIYIMAIYALARVVEGHRHAVDRLVTAIVSSMFLVALMPLVSLVWSVVSQGLTRFDLEFFTYSMRGVLGEGGGAYHAIIGTLIITGLTTLISVPIGIFAAIYLVEYGNKNALSRGLTFFVDVMTGIPSIVAGLFAISLFTLFFGQGVRMGIIGAVALTVLMVPVVVRSTEEMLRLVPNELREASYALGVPKWLTISKIVLPTSIAGIATGVTLAIARVIGETAPLLVTVGTTDSTNLNPFDGRMQTMPIFAYYSYATPGIPKEPYFERMWAAALTLVLIVMVLNLAARLISKLFAPKSGR